LDQNKEPPLKPETAQVGCRYPTLKTGYFAHYHANEESWGDDLPEILYLEETLDLDIERLRALFALGY
jgi:hypothetical protein